MPAWRSERAMASTYHCMWEMEKMFPRGGHSAAVTSHKDRQPGRRQEGGEYGKGGREMEKRTGMCKRTTMGGAQSFNSTLFSKIWQSEAGAAAKSWRWRWRRGGGEARLTVDSSQWIRGRNVSNVRW